MGSSSVGLGIMAAAMALKRGWIWVNGVTDALMNVKSLNARLSHRIAAPRGLLQLHTLLLRTYLLVIACSSHGDNDTY
jgi:hypothetical protein